MKQVSAEMLAAQLNLGQVTAWRLHWLYCDLTTIQRDMAVANFAQKGADLNVGVFAEFLERVERVTIAYSRLRWEVKTMLHRDYDDEIDLLFDSLEKHGIYLAELEKVKTLLSTKSAQILAEETARVNARINDISTKRYF